MIKKAFLFVFVLIWSSIVIAQWSEIETPPIDGYRDLQHFDTNKLILAGGHGNVNISTDDGETWNTYNTGIGYVNPIIDVHMTSANIGYALAEYGPVLLKTLDGGMTWDSLNPGIVDIGANAIHFINDTMGFFCGESYKISKTIDGGLNWEIQGYGSFSRLRDFYFISPDTGFCVGDAGHIFKTTDQGESWFALTSGPIEYLYCVMFLDNDTGYVCGDDGCFIKTTNGGENWTSLNTGATDALNYLYFLNTEEGYVVGENGVILHTYDGGLTWESEAFDHETNLKRVDFYYNKLGYICGLGDLFLQNTCTLPIAGYTYITEGLNVTFSDTSSNGDAYWWDFGDGVFSVLQNPQHVYADTGTYRICSIVTNSCGTDSISQTIQLITTNLSESALSNQMTIYPNPSNGSFTISNPNMVDISQIKVLDLSGKTIMSKVLNLQSAKIEFETQLPSGSYYLVITSNNKAVLKKIVIK